VNAGETIEIFVRDGVITSGTYEPIIGRNQNYRTPSRTLGRGRYMPGVSTVMEESVDNPNRELDIGQ